MIADLERVVTLLVNGALARLTPGWRRAHAADRGPARWPESDQGASLGAVDLAEAGPVLVAPPVNPRGVAEMRQGWASTSITDQTVSQDQKSIYLT